MLPPRSLVISGTRRPEQVADLTSGMRNRDQGVVGARQMFSHSYKKGRLFRAKNSGGDHVQGASNRVIAFVTC
jgi:hypothetical protein